MAHNRFEFDMPASCDVVFDAFITITGERVPAALRWLIEPLVKRIFDYQTRRRFVRLRDYLASGKDEIETWQRATARETARI